MRRIITSLLAITILIGVVAVGSRAFFSDTETSTGNVLGAGAIDLKVDNTSYRTNVDGQLVASQDTTWELNDLTIQKFFNFFDLKPGDQGEDTISLHVYNNNAWACANVQITENSDNGYSEPEDELSGTATDQNDGTPNGDLGEELHFAFWADDGDNVLEEGEQILVQGPASNVLNGGTLALAQPEGQALFGNDPLTGDQTYYIGKYYCYGNFTPVPETQGVNTPPTERTTGFTCNGEEVSNLSQTDKLVGDISFYAVQSRNNPNFDCANVEWPQQAETPTIGAVLAAHTQPTGEDCDVNVSDGGDEPNTIAEGIALASNGDTVCVDAGTYDEDVIINKEIILSGDGASATSVINGQTAGQGAAVTIAANNVTLEGFEINGLGIAALWLNTGITGATVRSNKIVSAGGGVTAVTTQGSQSNHVFSNNEFVGNASGQVVYVNGDVSLVGFPSDNVDFDNNTFSGTIIAGGEVLGIESTNSQITNNVFKSTLTSTYAIAETWKDDASFHFNNFNGVGGIKVRNSDPDQNAVNAENNWWGAAIPAGHTTGNVDDNPKEASAFPEN